MSNWPRRVCLLCVLRLARRPCPPSASVLVAPHLDSGGGRHAGLVVIVVVVDPMMDARSCPPFVRPRLPRWLAVSFCPGRLASTRPFSRTTPLLRRLRPPDLARRSSRMTCAWLRGERGAVGVTRSARRVVALRDAGRNQLVRHLQIENGTKERRHTIIQHQTARFVVIA